VLTRLAGVIGGKRTLALVLALVCGGVGVLAGVVMPAGAPAAGGRQHHRARQHRTRLARPRAFASCASLVGYARHYLALTRGVPETPAGPVSAPVASPTPVFSGVPAPAPGAMPPGVSTTGGAAYSTTNDQEPGVGEPDAVKTDGSTIFAVSQNALYAVAVGGDTPRVVGSLDLGSSGYGSELLLSGSKLIVISSQHNIGPALLRGQRGVATVRRGAPSRSSGAAAPSIAPVPIPSPARIYPSPYYEGGQTTLRQVDVTDPASMKITATLTIDGSFVDARQNGATTRVVISSAPRAIAYPAVRGSAKGYVPSWRFQSRLSGRRFSGPVARCDDILHPAQFSGLGMVTILTVDLGRGLAAARTDTLMADAQVVYGSQDSLYVATERWIAPATPVAQLPSSLTTQIDRFDATAPDRTTYTASGEVPGYLLNQFSLSESAGYLRVASTSSPDWWDGTVPRVRSQSYVTVLATSGSQLVPVGRLSGLGSGQRIYSVRFVGDVGYVVTFRQVDPLYTIDLSDPTAPRVAGQLELEGYSSYLHPLGSGLLLGVGDDVGTTNEPSGAQLELFDVSDPSAPRLVQKTTLGEGSSSQVQYDHHAFLFWPPMGLAVLPVQIYPSEIGSPTPAPAPGGASPNGWTGAGQTRPGVSDGFVGAVGFHIDQEGITELGRVSHPTTNGYAPPISRSIVIGDLLYTLSDEGVLASSLDTLAPIAFASFPAPSRTVPPPAVYAPPAGR
jgi:hypothetical protein